MGRQLLAPAPRAIAPVASVALRAYPDAAAPPRTPTAVLTGTPVTSGLDARKAMRLKFGRSISLDRIEVALDSASYGQMRDLTDLSRETVDTDPHLGSVLNKRFGAVASLPWEVQPATGANINRDRAQLYAEVVREQLHNMKTFRKNLMQLAWALFDGRAALEIKWIEIPLGSTSAHDGVRLAVQSMEWIHPRRLSYGSTRQLMIQDEVASAFGGYFSAEGLPVAAVPDKFVWWEPQRFGEYQEREGLARRVLYWSFFKRFSARERMILVELFGKPWRVLEVGEESTAGHDELEAAEEILDGLGSSYTARLPRGTKLNVTSPQRSAGDVHGDVIAESDKQISKLVLGQIGTTDGVAAGLNSNVGSMMQGEQHSILITDARELAEVVETMLTDRIIAINFGEQAVDHAPHFVLRSDLPVDRKSEIERLQGALDAGLEIGLNEAYEAAGFSKPSADVEPVLRMEQPPMLPLANQAPAPRPVVVYPTGSSPATGEQQPPAQVASNQPGSGEPAAAAAPGQAGTVTVREDRAARGLPPLGDERDDLTVTEFEALQTSQVASQVPSLNGSQVAALMEIINQVARDELPAETGVQIMVAAFQIPRPTAQSIIDSLGAFVPPAAPVAAPAAAPSPDDEDDEDDDEPVPAAPPLAASRVMAGVRKVGDKWRVVREDGTGNLGEYETKEEAEERLRQIEYYKHVASHCRSDIVLEVGQDQPSTPNGNPEEFVVRGVREAVPAINRWIERFESAVDGLAQAGAIRAALERSRAGLETAALARVFERRMLQSLMLGVIDSAREIETGDEGIGEERVEQVVERGEEIERAVQAWRARLEAASSKLRLGPGAPFHDRSFEDAVKFFRGLNVMDRATFDRIAQAARRRAFTVSGIMADQAIDVLKAELEKQVAEGADLRAFKEAVRTRMSESGFSAYVGTLKDGRKALNASHVETVFRTNVLNAYGTGRAVHQTQPEVMRSHPVLEIRSIQEPGRTREAHLNANGVKLSVDDPFWERAYPPFGFNCRCRVISRPRSQLSQVVSGSTVVGLPDDGFTSGRPRLF